MGQIDPGAKFFDRLFRNGLSRENVDDLAVLPEDKRPAGEANSRRIGAAADDVGAILQHLIQRFFGHVKTESRVSLEPGAALQSFRPTGTPARLGIKSYAQEQNQKSN